MKTQKKVFLLLFLLFFVTVVPLFGAGGKRHIEEPAGYSLIVPNQWQYTDIFHTEYRGIWIRKEDFCPHLLFFEDTYTGPLDPYINNTIEEFKKDTTQFLLVEKKEFITDNGMKGIKFVTLGTRSGLRIRMVCYVFKKPNNQAFIVLCQCLEKNKRTEKTFDKCIKTLEFL